MSFGAGHWPFLLILLVIVLIIWGPGKLPDLGQGLGKAIREFRKASSDVKDSFNQATTPEPTQQYTPPAATQPPAPPPAQQQPVAPAGPAAGGEQHPSA